MSHNSLGGRLPTLDEHNNQKRMMERFLHRPGAGVACPSCAAEMVLTYPGQVNTSSPPSENVHCPKCGHAGLKY